MAENIEVTSFLKRSENYTIIDARSQGEFQRGHIPGALNVPLLNNEERAIVGTTYKQQGRQQAVIKGFDLVGPKFSSYIHRIQSLAKENQVYIYCWRGGMRSNIMAWVVQMAGIKPTVLKGGYKSFRNLVHETINKPFDLRIIGGRTGSGKTAVIHELSKAGIHTLDLEGFARHKGSAFGALGQENQPTTEHFENLLGYSLYRLPPNEPVFVENESRLIGSIKIPDNFYAAMRKARVYEVNATKEQRVKRIKNEYAVFPVEDLIVCTKKLERKLGNKRMNEAVVFLNEGNMEGWINMMLEYYDQSYSYGNSLRDPQTIKMIETGNGEMDSIINQILNAESESIRN